jgi:hypothetical protein
MKIQIEQTIILHMTPNEAAWLKKHLADPPPLEEPSHSQKKRIELHAMLHEALEELNY